MCKAFARIFPLFLILAPALPLTAADLQVGKVTYTSTLMGFPNRPILHYQSES